MAKVTKSAGFSKDCDGCGAEVSYTREEVKSTNNIKDASITELLCDTVPADTNYVECPSCDSKIEV